MRKACDRVATGGVFLVLSLGGRLMGERGIDIAGADIDSRSKSFYLDLSYGNPLFLGRLAFLKTPLGLVAALVCGLQQAAKLG